MDDGLDDVVSTALKLRVHVNGSLRDGKGAGSSSRRRDSGGAVGAPGSLFAAID
jgi:hypothetical protein